MDLLDTHLLFLLAMPGLAHDSLSLELELDDPELLLSELRPVPLLRIVLKSNYS